MPQTAHFFVRVAVIAVGLAILATAVWYNPGCRHGRDRQLTQRWLVWGIAGDLGHAIFDQPDITLDEVRSVILEGREGRIQLDRPGSAGDQPLCYIYVVLGIEGPIVLVEIEKGLDEHTRGELLQNRPDTRPSRRLSTDELQPIRTQVREMGAHELTVYPVD